MHPHFDQTSKEDISNLQRSIFGTWNGLGDPPFLAEVATWLPSHPGSRRRKRWPISSSRWGSEWWIGGYHNFPQEGTWENDGFRGSRVAYFYRNAASCWWLDFCEFTSSLWHVHLLCGNPPQITIIDWWVEIFFADFAEATWGTTRWPVFCWLSDIRSFVGKLGRCSLVPPGASSWLLLCQMISTFYLGQSSFKSQDLWSKDVKSIYPRKVIRVSIPEKSVNFIYPRKVIKSIYPRKVKSILSIPEKSYINKNDSNNLFTDLKIFGNSPSLSVYLWGQCGLRGARQRSSADGPGAPKVGEGWQISAEQS